MPLLGVTCFQPKRDFLSQSCKLAPLFVGSILHTYCSLAFICLLPLVIVSGLAGFAYEMMHSFFFICINSIWIGEGGGTLCVVLTLGSDHASSQKGLLVALSLSVEPPAGCFCQQSSFPTQLPTQSYFLFNLLPGPLERGHYYVQHPCTTVSSTHTHGRQSASPPPHC
jgi:hypothetical protein